MVFSEDINKLNGDFKHGQDNKRSQTVITMATCMKCGTNIVQSCKCFTGREKLNEFRRLALREEEVVEKVQFENKPLFIEIAELNLRKKADIEVVGTFFVSAKAQFSGKELGSLREFTIRLLDWNEELIYWRKEQNPLSESHDSLNYEWNLEVYRTQNPA